MVKVQYRRVHDNPKNLSKFLKGALDFQSNYVINAFFFYLTNIGQGANNATVNRESSIEIKRICNVFIEIHFKNDVIS